MYHYICVLYFLLTSLTFNMIFAELFSALVDLARSNDAEKVLVEELSEYIKNEDIRLKNLKQLLNDINMDQDRFHRKDLLTRNNNSELNNLENYFSNPVDAYKKISYIVLDLRPRLMKAIYGDIEPITKIGEPSSSELQEVLKYDSGSLIKSNSTVVRLKSLIDDFPTVDDLGGSIDALFRLQDTYKLDTRLMATGQKQSNMDSSSLKAFECFGLGYYANRNEDYYHASLWLTEALYQYDREERRGEDHLRAVTRRQIDRVIILDYLVYATYKQGRIRTAINYNKQILDANPAHERALKNEKIFKDLLEIDEIEGRRRKGESIKEEDLINLIKTNSVQPRQTMKHYEALCRREGLASLTADKYCRYYVPHPYFTYQPLKEMVISLNPFLVVWYNLIDEEEIEHIQKLSTPLLKRATVQNSETGQMEPAEYRISKSAWLGDDWDDVIIRINKRINMVTGLTLDHAEELQVVNYGIGGQYEPHLDHAMDHEVRTFSEEDGNRIATLIFYMSDVQAGGSTVFTEINEYVEPIKGSAAFWFNLKKNGRSESLTRHAACPVLSGSKWVMNKWFHVRGQEYSRPCALDPLL